MKSLVKGTMGPPLTSLQTLSSACVPQISGVRLVAGGRKPAGSSVANDSGCHVHTKRYSSRGTNQTATRRAAMNQHQRLWLWNSGTVLHNAIVDRVCTISRT